MKDENDYMVNVNNDAWNHAQLGWLGRCELSFEGKEGQLGDERLLCYWPLWPSEQRGKLKLRFFMPSN